jgi:hypothetical protein
MAFENIQNKSRKFRQRVLFWVVGVLMLLIVGGWVLTLRNSSYGSVDRPRFLENIRNIGQAIDESFSGVTNSVDAYRERREQEKQEAQEAREAQNTATE